MVLLDALIISYRIALKARNLSPSTIANYEHSVRTFTAWCEQNGHPTTPTEQRHGDINAWIAAMHAAGIQKDSSILTHYRCLQQWFKWLLAEDEITVNPMARTSPPKAAEELRPIIADADLVRLVEACEGKHWMDRRDMAIVRVLIDTGMRCGELVGIRVTDVDLTDGTVLVTGKGRRQRIAPLGSKATQAIDRYLRARIRARHADSPHLWVSTRSAQLGDEAVRAMLRMRADRAGITAEIYPHLFRHTAAHNWLKMGGQEGDLMSIAGWRSRAMLARYGQSAAAERAREAHKRLAPGDRI